MAESIDLTGMNIPNHIAIIMDGNGRWAKKRFLPRNAGHMAGAKTVEKIIEDAYDLGVKYLTVYKNCLLADQLFVFHKKAPGC